MAEIDIGSAAINRSAGLGSYTLIAKENPANYSGKITSVEGEEGGLIWLLVM